MTAKELKARLDAELAENVMLGREPVQRALAIVVRTVSAPPVDGLPDERLPSPWEVVRKLDDGKDRADAVMDWLCKPGRLHEATRDKLCEFGWEGHAPVLVEYPNGVVREFAVAELSLEIV